jgi:lambda family phage tail tape measure protein
MSALGSLVVSLALDHTKFDSGLNKAEHATDKAMRGVESATKRGGGSFTRFTDETRTCLARLEKEMGSLLTLGRAVSIFEYAGRPLLNFAGSAITAADGINDLSERTGIAVETLSKLSYAAQQNGTDINTVGESFNKLTKLMYDAATGGKESRAMFKALGVDMATIQNMDVEKVIMRLADITKAMPESARAAFLENVKKGLGDLTQLLSSGSEGLRTQFDEAVKRGVVLSTENAQAAGEFKDQMDALGMTFTSVAQRMASAFLPSLTSGGQSLADFARTVEDNRTSISAWIGTIGGGAAGLAMTRYVANLAVSKKAAIDSYLGQAGAARAAQAARVELLAAAEVAARRELANTQAAVASAAARVASERIQVQSMQQMAVYGSARAAALASLAAAETTHAATLTAETAAARTATQTHAALTAAQAGTSAGARIGATLLTALGGPLGALITVLGLGATAWMVWGDKAESAYEKAKRGHQDLDDQVAAIIARQKREASFGTGDAAVLNEGIAQLRASIRAKESGAAYRYGTREQAPKQYQELDDLRAKLKAAEAALANANKPQPAPVIPKLPSLKFPAAETREKNPLTVASMADALSAYQLYDLPAFEAELAQDQAAEQSLSDHLQWMQEERAHQLATLAEIGDPRAAWNNLENRLSRARAGIDSVGGIISSAEASNQSQVVAGIKSQAQAQMDLRAAIGQQGDTLADMLPDLKAMMMLYGPEQRAEIQAMIDKILEWQAIGQQKGWQSGMAAGLHEYSLAAVDTFATVKDATLKAMQGMEDGILNFTKTGKLSFRDMANSIIDDMLRMSIRAGITAPLSSMLGSFIGSVGQPANIAAFSSANFADISAFSTAFAKGGTPDGVSAWRNQVVDRPTFFKFASGGVFGEAGPEAIMPLARGPDGNLGVRASGSGGNVQVIINNNATGAQATQSTRSDGKGGSIIDVFIEQVKGAIAGDIARGNGAIPAALGRTYGLNPTPGMY